MTSRAASETDTDEARSTAATIIVTLNAAPPISLALKCFMDVGAGVEQ